MLAYVRDGDTVIVHSMDRLARNLDDLRRLVRGLTGRGVAVQFVDTFTAEDSPMATLLLSVLGAFTEFERNPGTDSIQRQRQADDPARRAADHPQRQRCPQQPPRPPPHRSSIAAANVGPVSVQDGRSGDPQRLA